MSNTPYRCTIWSENHSVNIYSPVTSLMHTFQHESQGYSPFIPGWRCSESPSQAPWRVVHYESSKTRLLTSDDSKTITVYADIATVQSGRVLAYLAVLLLEVQRQQNRQLMAHAAAVSKHDNAILVLGERGEGKTSVALKLCRDFGYKLLSNDITIIGHSHGTMRIYDGTKVIGLRYAAVRNRYPELINLFGQEADKGDSWNNKIFVEPSSLGVQIEKQAKPCTKAVMVHLDCTGQDELNVMRLGGSRIQLLLYENFSRNIRGVALPFIGGSDFEHLDYMPSFDAREYHVFRTELINFLLKTIGLHYVSGGNLDEICSTIDQI